MVNVDDIYLGCGGRGCGSRRSMLHKAELEVESSELEALFCALDRIC